MNIMQVWDALIWLDLFSCESWNEEPNESKIHQGGGKIKEMISYAWALAKTPDLLLTSRIEGQAEVSWIAFEGNLTDERSS